MKEKKEKNQGVEEIFEKTARKWQMKGQGHLAFPLPQHYLYTLGDRVRKGLLRQIGKGGRGIHGLCKLLNGPKSHEPAL